MFFTVVFNFLGVSSAQGTRIGWHGAEIGRSMHGVARGAERCKRPRGAGGKKTPKLEDKGFEPLASRMQSGRSTTELNPLSVR